jgi:hypothetical protein
MWEFGSSHQPTGLFLYTDLKKTVCTITVHTALMSILKKKIQIAIFHTEYCTTVPPICYLE